MIKTIIFDFSRVLLFPKDPNYSGSLNQLYKTINDKKDFQIYQHYNLNGEILEYFKKIKDQFNLYIFTSGTIQADSELRKVLEPIFKEIFTVSKIGISKTDTNSYQHISNKLGTSSEEILFIDDTEENIQTATKAGWNTILYKSNLDLFQRLKEFNIIE